MTSLDVCKMKVYCSRKNRCQSRLNMLQCSVLTSAISVAFIINSLHPLNVSFPGAPIESAMKSGSFPTSPKYVNKSFGFFWECVMLSTVAKNLLEWPPLFMFTPRLVAFKWMRESKWLQVYNVHWNKTP